MSEQYQIIRLGQGFGLAIVQTPPGRPGDAKAREKVKYYRWADWAIGEHPPFTWAEISEIGVIGYFSGQADGQGFEDPPATLFSSLDEVTEFLRAKRSWRTGKPMTIRLRAVIGEGDTLTPDMRGLAARLLRESADAVERGHTVGNYNHGSDPHEGGFIITDSKNEIPD